MSSSNDVRQRMAAQLRSDRSGVGSLKDRRAAAESIAQANEYKPLTRTEKDCLCTCGAEEMARAGLDGAAATHSDNCFVATYFRALCLNVGKRNRVVEIAATHER